jgi:aminoacylase
MGCAMKQIIHDMTNLLCSYVRINTSHPHPDYAGVFALFEQRATQDGFEHKRIPLPSGRQVLVIIQRGSDPALPALALNHHMDVVPAPNPVQWKHDPFKGVSEDNIIHGRGTQDMKGVGAVHYGALLQLKRLYGIPRRTICLLFVPDEELGGFTGVKQLVQTDAFKALNIGYVLDEGLPSGDPGTLFIKTSERRPLHIVVTSSGKAGHGSRLMALNAVHELIIFLSKVVEFQQGQKRLLKESSALPGNLLSMNITSLRAGMMNDGGVSINVVPDTAQATIDIRIPQGMQTTQVLHLIESFLSGCYNVKDTIQACADEQLCATNKGSDFYQAVQTAVQAFRLQVVDYEAEEASDLRFYVSAGIQGIGLTPFTCTENIHGIDESISVHDVSLGIDVFLRILVNFAGEGLSCLKQ